MAKERRDIASEVKKRVSERFAEPGRKAKKLSDAGKLKLVTRETMQPFEGYGFNLDKGQVLRYELTTGPQIIDTTYLVRSRPVEEWADCWMTGAFGSMVYSEGTHYFSSSPWVRPLLTVIKDRGWSRKPERCAEHGGTSSSRNHEERGKQYNAQQ